MHQFIDVEYFKELKGMYWLSQNRRYELAKQHVKSVAKTPCDYEEGIRIICAILEY